MTWQSNCICRVTGKIHCVICPSCSHMWWIVSNCHPWLIQARFLHPYLSHLKFTRINIPCTQGAIGHAGWVVLGVINTKNDVKWWQTTVQFGKSESVVCYYVTGAVLHEDDVIYMMRDLSYPKSHLRPIPPNQSSYQFTHKIKCVIQEVFSCWGFFYKYFCLHLLLQVWIVALNIFHSCRICKRTSSSQRKNCAWKIYTTFLTHRIFNQKSKPLNHFCSLSCLFVLNLIIP